MKHPIDQTANNRTMCLVGSHAQSAAGQKRRRPAAVKNVTLQSGLSLIELMVAITLGLIILASLSSLFINQSKARVELDKSNRMIDNGRYTLELLSETLRLAGYYGELAPAPGVPPLPGTLPDPCSTVAADIGGALQLAVQGYNAATAATQVASPPCGLTYAAGNTHSMKPGSDVLVIRRASTAAPVAATAPVDGTTYFQLSHCDTDPTPIYQVATAPATFNNLHKKDCAALADLRRFLVQIYFVAPHNVPGDGIPTLKRLELATDNTFQLVPLVEGIEFMQIEYALDTNGDGEIDGSYVDCIACTVADWANVVSVKVSIVARNTEPTVGQNDTKTYSLGTAGNFTPSADVANFKRHAYTKVIRLVNPAGRRETP